METNKAQAPKRERWKWGEWVRGMLVVSDVRYTQLREILGFSNQTMTRYTKHKPNSGYIEIPHAKVIAEMAIVLNVPIADAMAAAGRAVEYEAKRELRNRGYGDLVDAYEATHGE